MRENGFLGELCELFKSFDVRKPDSATAVHSVAIEVISTLMCPVYGDFYSFPWKRGPHDNILDYVEAVPIFEACREAIYRTAIADGDADFL